MYSVGLVKIVGVATAKIREPKHKHLRTVEPWSFGL